MTRFIRRIAACFAIASLAFTQLAVSAYACPAGMDEQASASMMALDCDGPANRNLCERHCDYGASSVQSSPSVAVAPEVEALPWRVEPFIALSFGTAAREGHRLPRIEPPPLARFRVLRI